MTATGSTSISYDGVGNPTTYNGYTLTWSGRQLMEMSMNAGQFKYTFQYNDEGIRTEKIDNGVRHEYSVSGGQINREVIYSSNGQYVVKDLRYYYDAAGHPSAIRAFTRTSSTAEFTSNIYYLLTNMQGDVIAIYNEAGQKIYEYAYDAWGNILRSAQISTGGSAANQVNPFRYRGYYYDTETGLYYLQSRYYNPQWGRFLNADGYVSTGTGLLGYNMYAYCDNNPVMGYDPTGEWNWGTFLSGANLIMVGAMAMATAATILSCGAAAPLMVVVAAATAVAGAATVVNGIAEVVETGTDYNFVRDGTFGGDEEAYNTYKAVTQTVAEIGTTICGAYNVANGGNICFVAGTLVLTATGHEAIERIEAGDWVWATDPETGETELKQVVQTFRNETKELVHITVNGEEIVCTPTHPFYVPQKGWTSAIDLRAGDILVMLNGEYVVVEQVQHELLESPETTYNFEVKDFHTYYVGEQGIFTHNMCKKAQIKNPSKSESRVWKGFKNSKNGLKTSGSGKNQRFYSWDNLHNEIEVFDRLGKHLGVMDPTTGEMIKSAVKGRWLKL